MTERTHQTGPSGTHHDITELLLDWSRGETRSGDLLFDAVYQQLHSIASRQFRGEQRNVTYQPTALVHEAFLRLVDQNRVDWQNRAHFFAFAARIMRQILVDRARSRRAQKRGGDQKVVALDTTDIGGWDRPADLVALDDALARLAELSPDRAKLVELRFFGGLKFKDIALLTGVSQPTVTRRWRAARAWLYNELSAGGNDGTRHME